MSLLNKNTSFSVRDYLFAAVGLLCVFWFFLSYSSQDPRSIIKTDLDRNSARDRAVRVLNDLGYSAEDIQTSVSLESNQRLLDSLQSKVGRHQLIQMLRDSSHSSLHPFYWRVHFLNIAQQAEASADQDGGPRQADDFRINLDEKGKLIEFLNPSNILPGRKVNTNALIAAFEADSSLKLWKSLPDSAWNRILRFNIEEGYGEELSEESADTIRTPGQSHTYTASNIERLGRYFLTKGGWDSERLVLEDIQIQTLRSEPTAEITFGSKKPLLGQDLRVEMSVLPTGALISMESTYNSSNGNGGFPPTIEFARVALVFLFGLITIILFYFRIRARAIDTKPSLVVGVVAGLIISAAILLNRLAGSPLFGSGAETSDLIGTALQMGFTGALASIAYFVVFAVGDSLMRHHWSEKLFSYDYLRQGMFFNKPIGELILRSIVLAFILCGLWSMMLALLPGVHLEVNQTFLHYEAAWAPVYLFLNNAWFSIILTLGVFAIAGTQLYGLFDSKVAAALLMTAGLALITPINQAMGPVLQEFAVFAVIGLGLTLIFLKWDMLTTFLTHFIFLLLVKTSSGWIVEGSPDLYVFIVFCAILLFNLVAGILFITKGKESKSLPRYVPDYVEEMAQEERIKQELQIAREVQQSFLPVKTPEIQNLDLAAICRPAYETGGDYYDFVRLDDHRIAVTIGDVSGKGIQAAFYMTFIKGILHSLCREIDSPADILKKTNRLFYDNAPRGTFISLVYGIVDLEKKTFHFARAGHNPVLKINGESGDVTELRPQGIGIGLTQGHPFDNNIEEMELTLSEDDLLVLYTDGIVEALNNEHTFYGTQRLNSMLKRNKNHSAADLLNTLSLDLKKFIDEAKQHDDMTMVVMKFKDSE